MKAFFPNAITSLNLLFGCIGILACFNGGLGFAGICILISATLDFFDGFVARLLGVSGDFGKQLDSLADVISFGALPGFIALNLIKQQQGGLYFDGEPLTNKIFLIICFLIPIFSALRL
ncbi:MAG: CDP-alcohol phosphatidyltransferase family protein, partial [Flavobacteriales bacterium]|nr:CDP-alcohol phosphatidyltransferase family protein [Flavobacteriales bacterium]